MTGSIRPTYRCFSLVSLAEQYASCFTLMSFDTERIRRLVSSESRIIPSILSYSSSWTYAPISAMLFTWFLRHTKVVFCEKFTNLNHHNFIDLRENLLIHATFFDLRYFKRAYLWNICFVNYHHGKTDAHPRASDRSRWFPLVWASVLFARANARLFMPSHVVCHIYINIIRTIRGASRVIGASLIAFALISAKLRAS